jgi:hypothetical protein
LTHLLIPLLALAFGPLPLAAGFPIQRGPRQFHIALRSTDYGLMIDGVLADALFVGHQSSAGNSSG